MFLFAFGRVGLAWGRFGSFDPEERRQFAAPKIVEIISPLIAENIRIVDRDLKTEPLISFLDSIPITPGNCESENMARRWLLWANNGRETSAFNSRLNHRTVLWVWSENVKRQKEALHYGWRAAVVKKTDLQTRMGDGRASSKSYFNSINEYIGTLKIAERFVGDFGLSFCGLSAGFCGISSITSGIQRFPHISRLLFSTFNQSGGRPPQGKSERGDSYRCEKAECGGVFIEEGANQRERRDAVEGAVFLIGLGVV